MYDTYKTQTSKYRQEKDQNIGGHHSPLSDQQWKDTTQIIVKLDEIRQQLFEKTKEFEAKVTQHKQALLKDANDIVLQYNQGSDNFVKLSELKKTYEARGGEKNKAALVAELKKIDDLFAEKAKLIDSFNIKRKGLTADKNTVEELQANIAGAKAFKAKQDEIFKAVDEFESKIVEAERQHKNTLLLLEANALEEKFTKDSGENSHLWGLEKNYQVNFLINEKANFLAKAKIISELGKNSGALQKNYNDKKIGLKTVEDFRNNLERIKDAKKAQDELIRTLKEFKTDLAVAEKQYQQELAAAEKIKQELAVKARAERQAFLDEKDVVIKAFNADNIKLAKINDLLKDYNSKVGEKNKAKFAAEIKLIADLNEEINKLIKDFNDKNPGLSADKNTAEELKGNLDRAKHLKAKQDERIEAINDFESHIATVEKQYQQELAAAAQAKLEAELAEAAKIKLAMEIKALTGEVEIIWDAYEDQHKKTVAEAAVADNYAKNPGAQESAKLVAALAEIRFKLSENNDKFSLLQQQKTDAKTLEALKLVKAAISKAELAEKIHLESILTFEQDYQRFPLKIILISHKLKSWLFV